MYKREVELMGSSNFVGGAGFEHGHKENGGFALLVVLFILLIIVGAAFFNNFDYGY